MIMQAAMLGDRRPIDLPSRPKPGPGLVDVPEADVEVVNLQPERPK